MNNDFQLSGALKELSSYPAWTQAMVQECDAVKRTVTDHPLWDLMGNGGASAANTLTFMVGIWPVIERFPGYMARSLLKTRYGRSAGDNLARSWLVRNIRVEQNHAQYWVDWAEGAGVPRDRLFNGSLPAGTQDLANWCEDISTQGSLAASLAAVNYAVEGATGEWAQILYENEHYATLFPENIRRASLRWLKLHAAYDDAHPWEALEIVCTLLGNAPSAQEVAHVAECIKRSYTCMRVLADRCLEPYGILQPETKIAQAA